MHILSHSEEVFSLVERMEGVEETQRNKAIKEIVMSIMSSIKVEIN
jgi:hypothetical protein